MAAPFRIEERRTPPPKTRGPRLEENQPSPPPPPDPNAGFKEYLSRLLKMIPAEIVGLYMIGSGFIPSDQPLVLIIWSAVCLVLLIILRIWGTADPAAGKPSQPVPVFISAIAFVIWLYWLGGPFSAYPDHNLHVEFVGSLLVLVWSFIVPIFLKGS
jgi:hypothetical protein